MPLNFPKEISALLQQRDLIDNSNCQVELLAGDGSSRRFYRIQKADADSFVIVLPPVTTNTAIFERGLAEAHAAVNICRHLQSHGIPVPDVLDFDPQTGAIFFQDLGETLFHDRIREQTLSAPEIKQHYCEVVEILVRMQILGRKGFDPQWCWDTPQYDRHLMLEKESGYFLQAFCASYLHLRAFPAGLDEEFKLLASRAARQPCDFFLHRDFQSRNLMICGGKIRIIDFQGGRLGPLGYDLASLLIDPYAGLSAESQADLFEMYLNILVNYIPIDSREFRNGYWSLAVQRNLQILGAFAFLSKQRVKPFFSRYLRPAAISLIEHLARPAGADYPGLTKLAERCLALLDNRLETKR